MENVWTRFMDMHSGGGAKEKWEYIYIEAPIEEAKIVFFNRFGHNPERVTCTCCGDDYSISEEKSLQQATGFERGCEWGKDVYIERASDKHTYRDYVTIEEYVKRKGVLVIYSKDIKESERKGDVPSQGYVWIN